MAEHCSWCNQDIYYEYEMHKKFEIELKKLIWDVRCLPVSNEERMKLCQYMQSQGIFDYFSAEIEKNKKK